MMKKIKGVIAVIAILATSLVSALATSYTTSSNEFGHSTYSFQNTVGGLKFTRNCTNGRAITTATNTVNASNVIYANVEKRNRFDNSVSKRDFVQEVRSLYGNVTAEISRSASESCNTDYYYYHTVNRWGTSNMNVINSYNLADSASHTVIQMNS